MSNSGGSGQDGWLRGRGNAWRDRFRRGSDDQESRLDAYTEPVGAAAIGIALTIYNQTASEVSGSLRIAALLAGLLLFASGFNQWRTVYARRNPGRDAEREEEYAATAGGAPATQQLNVAASGPQVNRGVDPDAVDDGGPGALPWLVMGLAVWLGLAVLANPTAPVMLTLLSIAAAFLLFSTAWGVVAADRQRRSGSTA